MTTLFLFVVGLATGSFLGALTFRLPKGLIIAKGRSICDHCKKKISWFDNIPLLSFVFLAGKCRHCRKKISSRYPLIELTTALGFVSAGNLIKQCSGGAVNEIICGWVNNLGIASLPFLLFILSIVIAIFVIDLENKIIPDNLTLLGFLSAFLFQVLTSPTAFANIASGFVVASFLLSINLATRGAGMGLGDVKFALFAGTLLGLKFSVVWLFVSFLTGALAGIILILMGKAKFGRQIPFGPFLVVSLVMTVLWGDFLINFFPL